MIVNIIRISTLYIALVLRYTRNTISFRLASSRFILLLLLLLVSDPSHTTVYTGQMVVVPIVVSTVLVAFLLAAVVSSVLIGWLGYSKTRRKALKAEVTNIQFSPYLAFQQSFVFKHTGRLTPRYYCYRPLNSALYFFLNFVHKLFKKAQEKKH